MAILTAAELRNGTLRTLVTHIPTLADVKDAELDEAITITQREVEEELCCRMDLLTIRPWSGAAASAVVDGEETEAPYPWPGVMPGDGFIRIRPRIRPIVSVESMALKVPGSLIAAFTVPLSWIQVDRRNQEILICPVSGTSILGSLMGGMGLGGGLIPGRMPNVVQLTYTAGLDAAGLKQWPQIKHLTEMRTVLHILKDWALVVNPTGVSSVSADGLSQSRSSGFIWKDIAGHVKTEADGTRDALLGIWDGPMLCVL